MNKISGTTLSSKLIILLIRNELEYLIEIFSTIVLDS